MVQIKFRIPYHNLLDKLLKRTTIKYVRKKQDKVRTTRKISFLFCNQRKRFSNR